MGTGIHPISPINSNGVNLGNLIIEIGPHIRESFPYLRLKEVLHEKHPDKTEKTLAEQAERRHADWQKKIAQTNARAEAMDKQRKPYPLPNEKRAAYEDTISHIQRKNVYEDFRLSVKGRFHERSPDKNKQPIGVEESTRIQERDEIEQRAPERTREKNELLSSPTEHHGVMKKAEGALTEAAREKSGELAELARAAREQNHIEKHEGIKKSLHLLQEQRAEINEAVENSKERAAYNRSLSAAPEERREIVHERDQVMVERYEKELAERMAPVLNHFENMKQRMIDFFNNSDENYQKFSQAVETLTARARERSSASMNASGNPKALRNGMHDVDYYGWVLGRMSDMLDHSRDTRAKFTQAVDDIIAAARGRSSYNMGLSGNPKSDRLVLSDLDYFDSVLGRMITMNGVSDAFNDKMMTVKAAIQIAGRNRSTYNDMLAGVPSIERMNVIQAFKHIIAHLFIPEIMDEMATLSTNTRKDHSAVNRTYIEKILNRLESLLDPPLPERYPNYLERLWNDIHALMHARIEMRDERREALHERFMNSLNHVNMALKQENITAIFGALLIDKTLKDFATVEAKLDTATSENTVEQRAFAEPETLDSVFTRVISNITHNMSKEMWRVQEAPIDYLFTLLPRCPDPVPLTDEFVPVERRIDDCLRQKNMFTYEELFHGMPSEVRRDEQEEAARLAERTAHTEYIADTEAEKKQNEKKALEESVRKNNLRAQQQKLVDERNLIDLFL